MTHAPKTEMGVPQAPQTPQQKPQPQPQNGKATPEKEPEMMVIPLEEMEQQPRKQKKTKR